MEVIEHCLIPPSKVCRAIIRVKEGESIAILVPIIKEIIFLTNNHPHDWHSDPRWQRVSNYATFSFLRKKNPPPPPKKKERGKVAVLHIHKSNVSCCLHHSDWKLPFWNLIFIAAFRKEAEPLSKNRWKEKTSMPKLLMVALQVIEVQRSWGLSGCLLWSVKHLNSKL